MAQETQSEKRAWTEQFEIAASELVDRVTELIREGNVRRMIIKSPNDNVLLDIPLNAGVAVGTVATLINPVLAALGALGVLIARVKIEIVRVDKGDGSESDNQPPTTTT